MIGIIQCGNTGSVYYALTRLGAQCFLADTPSDLQSKDNITAVVFPGDGNFNSVMRALVIKGWDIFIKDWINDDKPFLGIYIGMQVLFEGSEEGINDNKSQLGQATTHGIGKGDINFEKTNAVNGSRESLVHGLGILQGTVRKFLCNKVPLIGWNRTVFNSRSFFQGRPATEENSIKKSAKTWEYFYYIHSYYVMCYEQDIISAQASYGIKYCASVERGLLTGVQFHPEKSGTAGIRFLKKWMEVTNAS